MDGKALAVGANGRNGSKADSSCLESGMGGKRTLHLDGGRLNQADGRMATMGWCLPWHWSLCGVAAASTAREDWLAGIPGDSRLPLRPRCHSSSRPISGHGTLAATGPAV